MKTAHLVTSALCLLALAVPAGARADGITYRTYFQDPGADPAPDHSLERHAIEDIDATPPGERITFAVRDYNDEDITSALIRAHGRGVIVDGVIDGDEAQQDTVQSLVAALGPDHAVVCGAPDFVFNSCIANWMPSAQHNSLMHNKFFTFSALDDGRSDVVLETSENFYVTKSTNQFDYYNDMVEIDGDRALYGVYGTYFSDLKAQQRTDDYYTGPEPAADAPDSVFLSPRSQPDAVTDDTIAEQLDRVDCSHGGSIRVANMAFRTERAVILDRLVKRHREGCDVDVAFSNADGDILAGLVSAGIGVHPFFMRAEGSRPQVIVHDKFFLVDAVDRATGRREKVTYAGTSNWRFDEQRSDDLLLRIVDDGVYDAYDRYWRLIAARAQSIQTRPVPVTKDTVRPVSVATPTRGPQDGWHRSAVSVRIAASDGHNVGASGLRTLHVELTGAQTGAWDVTGEHDGYSVLEVPVTAEGETEVTTSAEDAAGNTEPPHSVTVRIDRTPPTIAGLPRDCTLWPPNHQMVHVADVTAGDDGSEPPRLDVSATSDAGDDDGDVAIDGGSVDLRAEKGDRAAARTYTVTATATDRAGNTATASGTCVVPHSM